MKLLTLITTITLLCIANPLLSMEEDDDAPQKQELTQLKQDLEDQEIGAKFRLLKATDPDKIFIRGLPHKKREPKANIIAKLLKFPDTITTDNRGNVIIDGQLIKEFVLNKSLKTMEEEQITKERKLQLQEANTQKMLAIAETKFEMLMKVDPHAVIVKHENEIILYSNEQKDELLKGLRSVVHAIDQEEWFGENTKEVTIQLDRLEQIPAFKKQKEEELVVRIPLLSHSPVHTAVPAEALCEGRERTCGSKGQKGQIGLTPLQRLATPAKVVGYTGLCLGLGYLLAQMNGTNPEG